MLARALLLGFVPRALLLVVGSIAWIPPAVAQVALPTDTLFTLVGEAAADALGRSVAAAGDVNGDGFGDVIVGAYLNDGGGADAGRAYVYFGGPTADRVADLVLTGAAAGDNFGLSVAGAGDVNGDGFADVVVGALFNDAGGSNAGRAYIYFGGSAPDGTADLILTGESAGDQFGWSVAGAGDVNGDGFGDVVVGALSNDAGGSGAGRAYVYFGGGTPDAVADLVLTGQAAGDGFGRSVAGAGDVNRDGFADVIVGAASNDAGGTNAGRAYVYFGGASPDAVADLVLTGPLAYGELGWSVAAAGDVNGDGSPDVIVGAMSSGVGGNGRAYVYYGGPGADAQADLVLGEEGAFDRFGISVAGAGDLNADGFADVIVGADRNDAGGSNAGRAYVYFGSPTPDTLADLTFTGDAAFDGFGVAVAGAGDLSGDGLPELIVGASANDAGGTNAGRAYVYGRFAVTSASLPVQIDGEFEDWDGEPATFHDPSRDAGPSGIDFTRVRLANDENRLYIRFDTTREVQPDEGHDIRVALDTDVDFSTGTRVRSLGAELMWLLGSRTGTLHLDGSPEVVQHRQLGFEIGPTVSGTEFELAISRGVVSSQGTPLFSGEKFRLLLFDNGASGDAAGTGLVYTFHPTPRPVSSISLAREAPWHVRVASYNIKGDGLFDPNPERQAALRRIVQAIDADAWILNEVQGDSAALEAKFEEWLPAAPGESWGAVEFDDGNAVVSRLPVLEAARFAVPSRDHVAVRVDLRPIFDSDLLVVANHWRCCANDATRQDQADGLIARLRQVREGTLMSVAPGTPIVAGGDLNLVGWRRQLETLLRGDIVANGIWGPDSPPDWDGSDFDVVWGRHPDARSVYTWRNDSDPLQFYPGKLDWLVYTGSVVTLEHHFVLDTRSMTPANLATHGLEAGDTELASDHAPIVADFARGLPLRAADAEPPRIRPLQSFPNPFEGSTSIHYEVPVPGPVMLRVHDAAGRLVRVLENAWKAAGRHAGRWDGLDEGGKKVPAGVYFVRLEAAGSSRTTRTVRLE